MTQFKEKSAKQRELVSAALFFYPVLQAADVLAYRATEVPVGEDQRQHIELMREIARRFNERFGEILVVPEHRIPEVGARIMDLQDPSGRCRRPAAPRRHGLRPRRARRDPKKIESAVTDSGREVRRGEGKEGIANLIDILAVARGVDQDADRGEFDGSGYGDFKAAVAEAVVELLAPVRERYEELRPDEAALERARRGRREGARDRHRHACRGPRAHGRRQAISRRCSTSVRYRREIAPTLPGHLRPRPRDRVPGSN